MRAAGVMITCKYVICDRSERREGAATRGDARLILCAL